VQVLIAGACARICAAGKAAGMLTGDPEEAARYFDIGFTFVAVGSDLGLLAQGAAKRAADFRRYLARRTDTSQLEACGTASPL
jgi:4-hydroxy-2-oxoheptanedioate aldolase